MSIKLSLVFGVLSLIPLLADAGVSCGKIGSYQDILQCAEDRAPEVQRALLESEQTKARIGGASQWQNPEFSLDSVSGTVGGEKEGETEIALGIPIELGGKISSRKAAAEGASSLAEARLADARFKARSDALLKLHRLRQLVHEQEVIEESISTFSKLISQYAKRRGLSPEQEISASVYRMAKSEYDLKKTETQEELAFLESYFNVVIGAPASQVKSFLPSSPKTWPKAETSFSPGRSPAFKAAQAELTVAEAELDLARGEAWPTITVGPSMKIEKAGSNSNQFYGFNVSLPLPIFSLNGGNKAAAASGVKVFEASKNAVLVSEESTRHELLQVYQQSVSVLASTLSHQEIEKKHSDVERMFLRGIVPSSLVIEAHRAFVELEKARNERELKALSALAAIHAIDGKKNGDELMKTLATIFTIVSLFVFGFASAEEKAKEQRGHKDHHEEKGHAHEPEAEGHDGDHKEDAHKHVDGHEEADNHDHGDVEKHGHEESEGHEEGEHGHGEGGSRVGPDKGILEASEENGIKLSPEAMKNFELQSQVLAGIGPWTLPSSARLLAGEEVNLFRLRDGFYKRIDFTLLKRNGEEITVNSKDLKPGDSVVIHGIGFLRIAEITAFGGAPEGHSH